MDDTRTKILEVAEDLVQRVGLNAMSYKHISDAVGIRKPSIHHHFPKKADLVDALLERCHISYGGEYLGIVEESGSAPEKLRKLAKVFEEGLQKQQLCLVGMISSDLNTLQDNSRGILEETIRKTVDIFFIAFKQGRDEGSLVFKGTVRDTSHAFLSFLIGAQITARAYGGVDAFRTATEAIISNWEK